MVTPKEMEQFVEEYSYFYSSENKFNDRGKENRDYIDRKHKSLGMYVWLGVSEKKIEDIAEDSVFPIASFNSPCQKITWKHVAWKAGRLKYKENGLFSQKYEKKIKFRDKCYAWDGMNGNENEILYIDKYLDKINEERQIISEELLIEKKKEEVYEQIKRVYEKLLHYQIITDDCIVKEIGPVYIITLIYFLSKGQFPIYDKYAHKAAKALFYNANPKDVSVETSLDKNDVDKVLTVYSEYCWLLTQLFNTYSISREQDRALWVYGHSKNKFPVSANANTEKKLFDFDRVIE